MTNFFLGIDLGGTEVKLAIADAKGNIIEQSSMPNSFTSDPKKILPQLIKRANNMKYINKVSGTGVGVAGDVDQKKGVLRFSPNLPKWSGIPIGKILKNGLKHRVVIDNDANAAAWGAFWLDAGGKAQNLVCITLGTGVGGGIICNGKLYHGTTGSAGEIGHITIDPLGPKCNCGNHGCVERFIGAAYLSEAAVSAIKNGRKSILPGLVGGRLDRITPRILDIAAHKNDKLANEIWQFAGEKLGIIIADLVNIINPEKVVLAGGVSKADGLILKPVIETVKKRAFKMPARACHIVISKYTQKLGVVGAA